jgi:hypothetical protein
MRFLGRLQRICNGRTGLMPGSAPTQAGCMPCRTGVRCTITERRWRFALEAATDPRGNLGFRGSSWLLREGGAACRRDRFGGSDRAAGGGVDGSPRLADWGFVRPCGGYLVFVELEQVVGGGD